MSKVVVCFDDREGRTCGDSSMDIAMTVPYVEGMTVSDLREAFLNKMKYEWDEEEVSTDDFAKENDLNVSGGWVLEESLHNVLMGGDWDVGSDSALYRMVHHVKTQIEQAAELTIE